MGLKRSVSIRQAMQYVADHPEMQSDELISLPVWELVVRTVFEAANSVDAKKPATMSKANAARAMILNRLVGRRRPGTHPATGQKNTLKFVDLTGDSESRQQKEIEA